MTALTPLCDAVISPCGKYRYRLSRTWGGHPLVFVMLNPSTADAQTDDPTIRRCIGFARREGFAGIDVVNLYAWRETSPKKLRKAIAPVGPDNQRTILAACSGRPVVLAWGVVPLWARDRAAFVERTVRDVAREVFHIGPLTADGSPRHPLYLPGDTALVPYPPRLP